MKKFIMCTLVALSFAIVCSAQTTKALYTAGYSSNFKMADPNYSNKVLILWKDYEDNTLDKHSDMFADTVTMLLSNGMKIKGKTESLTGMKQYRGSLTGMKLSLDAWMSLKSQDKGENLVCVWGNESFTDKDGKQVSMRVQEVWGFNSAGKVSMMMQYAGQGSL